MNLTNLLRNFLASWMLIVAVATVCRADVVDPLSPGDIAFIGFNADGNDDFAILIVNDIPASTVIYFTDKESDGTSIIDNAEGTLTWTTPGAVLSAGTVVIFTDVDLSTNPSFGVSHGTLIDEPTDAGFNIAAGGDNIIAYVGTANSPTTYLAAIANHEDEFDGTNGTLPTTLNTSGSVPTAVLLPNGTDGGEYDESNGTDNTPYHLLALINDGTNWTVDGDDGELFIPFNGFSGFTVLTAISYDGAAWSNTDGPDASGRVAVTFNGSFSTTETLSLTDLTVNSGTLTADHALTISNNLVIDGGILNLQASSTVSGNLNITSSGSLTITSGNRLELSGDVTGDNSGSFIISQGGGFKPASSTSFTNQNVQMTRSVSSSGYSYVTSPMDLYLQPGKINEYYYDATTPVGADAADNGEYGSWVKIDNGDLSEGGRGYLSYREGDLTWTGSPNTGTISVAMLGTNGADGRNISERGWNLVGNPYTFPIDIASFTGLPGNDINANIYLWDATLSGGDGDYATAVTTGTIPSGQAFFIKVDDGENSIDFTMDMDDAVGTNTTANYRVAEGITALELEFDYGNAHSKKLKYQFGDQFSDGYDRFDAYQFGIAEPDFQVSNLMHDSRFIKLTFKNIAADRVIPIEVKAKSAGNVNIKVTDWKNIPEGTAIALVHLETQQIYSLDGESTSINTTVSSGGSNAFELRFSPLEVTGFTNQSKDVSFYGNVNAFVVNIDDDEITHAQLNIFSIDGRLLNSGFYDQIEKQIEVPSNQRGMFILQLVTNKGTFSGKILK